MPKKTTRRKSSESSDSRSESSSDRSERSDHSDRSERKKSSESEKSESDVSSRSHHEEKGKKTRNKTSYQFFCDKERKKIKKEHPSWKMTEVSQELGKRWGELDDKKKRVFARQAERARN